jgi:hypothetical protein
LEVGAPKSIRINASKSLFSPELVMSLASATELNILVITREMRAAPDDQELQALLLEDSQIIDSVRQEGLQVKS